MVVFRVLEFMSGGGGTTGGARIVQRKEGIVFRPRFAAAQVLGEKSRHENPGQAKTDEESDAEHVHAGGEWVAETRLGQRETLWTGLFTVLRIWCGMLRGSCASPLAGGNGRLY
jgi:hypothetical protein